MNINVIGFGALNFDYLYTVDALAYGDQQVAIKKTLQSPGGSSANTIYGLAKLGIKTGFIGAVGDDLDGEQILTQMRKLKIEVSKIRVITHEHTSKVFVFIDDKGERAMYSLPGASNIFRVRENDIEWLSKSKYIIFSPMPGNEQLQYQNEIIAQIHRNTRIVFMPGALFSKYGFSGLEQIVNNSYLIILNRRELQELTGREHLSGAKWLVENGCHVVAVTLGKEGCYIYDDKTSATVPTPELPKDKIVDSTGAGDAFAAGLIYGLLRGKPLLEAALLGNLAARACVRGLGARFGLPEEGLLKNEFEKYSKVIENEQ
jgi:ribokinase